MDFFILDWLNLLIRWLHVITGIAWIGASFYFVWLDNNLENPPPWKKDKGVSGDLWAFHGGGIYEVAKYSLAPQQMPKTLHWFKWEAYATWITGSLLLIVLYYFQADLYLRGDNPWIDSSTKAVGASVVFIVLGVVIYEGLLRTSVKNKIPLFITCVVAFVGLWCWLATHLFSDRAAFLHVGAMLATIMAANVFFGIIPAQKKFVVAIETGVEPNKESMLFAKLRSVHNNYFTLPVLFCMISNHYAFLYAHEFNWVILITIITTTAYARHFFNLKHKGIIKPHILIVSVAVILCLMLAMAILQANKQKRVVQSQVHSGGGSRVQTLVDVHCAVCHAESPTQLGFSAPPAGLLFENLTQINEAKARVILAIESQYMPLGNITLMTPEEREELLAFLRSE